MSVGRKWSVYETDLLKQELSVPSPYQPIKMSCYADTLVAEDLTTTVTRMMAKELAEGYDQFARDLIFKKREANEEAKMWRTGGLSAGKTAATETQMLKVGPDQYAPVKVTKHSEINEISHMISDSDRREHSHRILSLCRVGYTQEEAWDMVLAIS